MTCCRLEGWILSEYQGRPTRKERCPRSLVLLGRVWGVIAVIWLTKSIASKQMIGSRVWSIVSNEEAPVIRLSEVVLEARELVGQ